MNSKRRLNKILIYAKKVKAIRILGGKCINCNESSIHKLCFHHVNFNNKENNISKLKYNRWSILENELNKCIILCNNCHTELHHSQKVNTSFKEENKKIYLEYKGIDSCENCKYNRCIDSLQFHHVSDKNFEFRTIQRVIRSINDINDIIKRELDICKVLCNNCHVELHSDILFYESNKDIILEKSNSIRENSKPLDRVIVGEMIDSGISVKEMMSILGCKKSAIYTMVKEISKKIEKT